MQIDQGGVYGRVPIVVALVAEERKISAKARQQQPAYAPTGSRKNAAHFTHFRGRPRKAVDQ
ncbi:MAG: hypothetical protein IPM07_22870 [Anaerolineales bacterium]|nr:hypothetical protein [Anaerolineales bacterium]